MKYLFNYLINNELIKENEIAILKYGMKVFLLNFISIISILISSFIMDNLLFGFLFLITFIPIRITFGGYHCKKPITCLIMFNSIYIILFQFRNIFKVEHLIILSLVALITPIYINNYKSHLICNHKRKNIIIIFINMISIISDRSSIINAASISLIYNLILVLTAYIIKYLYLINNN